MSFPASLRLESSYIKSSVRLSGRGKDVGRHVARNRGGDGVVREEASATRGGQLRRKKHGDGLRLGGTWPLGGKCVPKSPPVATPGATRRFAFGIFVVRVFGGSQIESGLCSFHFDYRNPGSAASRKSNLVPKLAGVKIRRRLSAKKCPQDCQLAVKWEFVLI